MPKATCVSDGPLGSRSVRLISVVRDHLRTIIERGTDRYGPEPTPMWMATLDARTGRYPEDDARPSHVPKRVYRSIDAPKGCSLYWDQPSIVAAHALSEVTGDRSFSEAADRYVQAFLARCVARTGVFLWGNHYYWEAFSGRVMRFSGEEPPVPCDRATETGFLHETRPIPPAWESFWRVSPEATERCIRALTVQHLFDPLRGGFNRHADGKSGCAFLEAGGILVEAFCWLAAKTGDRALVDVALRVARYSWEHRGERTDLPVNKPGGQRWDSSVTTTEVGLWAGSLLRGAELVGVDEFVQMALRATAGYLRHGWDASARRYYGRLCSDDGAPDLSEPTTPYMPGIRTDLWRPQFPAHDYPFSLAETCLTLLERTGDEVFAEGAARWVEVVRRETAERIAVGAYAEHWGRAILFLDRAGEALGDAGLRADAASAAGSAIASLFRPRVDGGMFAGHPGEDRYDAVDGVGYLLLALLRLATGGTPALMGMGL